MSSAGPHSSEPIGAPRPFETQNIIVSASRVNSVTSTPGGDGGVEHPRAVEMDRHARLVGDLADRAQLLDRHHASRRRGPPVFSTASRSTTSTS